MGGGQTKQQKTAFEERYTLKEVIGKGAFSEVKRCTLNAKKTVHAVKIINKSALTTEDMTLLTNEINILSMLSHPNIIHMSEFVDEKNKLYIVTELVEGGELFDRIVRKETYSEKDARGLVKVLLSTIAYLHDQKIVHRDLKPENLLLMSTQDDMNIKIADFGLAKYEDKLIEGEVPCGTPGYVAPEILLGKKYGAEVDIWSIGVITYILIAGYPPFYEEDQKKLFKRIKAAKYDFHKQHWENKSKESIDIIKHMLCKDQKQRWTAKKLLDHPWMHQSEQELEKNSLSGSQVTLRRFNARRRFRAATQAIILTNRIRTLIGNLTATLHAETAEYKKGLAMVMREDVDAASDDQDLDQSESSVPIFLLDGASKQNSSMDMSELPEYASNNDNNNNGLIESTKPSLQPAVALVVPEDVSPNLPALNKSVSESVSQPESPEADKPKIIRSETNPDMQLSASKSMLLKA